MVASRPGTSTGRYVIDCLDARWSSAVNGKYLDSKLYKEPPFAQKIWWVLDTENGAISEMYEFGYCEDILYWLNDRDSGYSLTDQLMHERIQP
jgi:hypothetical protein